MALPVVGGLLAGSACHDPGSDAPREQAAGRGEAVGREPLEPLQPPPPVDGRLVALGRKLFNDRRLSADDTVACASCHAFEKGGADGRVAAVGIGGQIGAVNAPTVLNSGLNFVQFWDGRATSLEDQVNGPLTNPSEMGSSWAQALPKIRADSDYESRFRALFPDAVTEDHVRGAIAAFERSLVAVDSPFDRWLRGDATALGAQEQAGYALFKGVGCIACHQGRNVGGNMFQRFGVLADYFADRGHVSKADYGRFNVTGNEADRFVFRVPSLRYVAHTAPYFHDGSAATLEQAVQVMARYQLGRTLTDDQVASIVAFLKSLAGPLPSAASG
ncbi:MAG: cytochrome-c peroxidase [Polyangiaceae bacterium]